MPRFVNILLQKSDASLAWGFDLVGGCDTSSPLTVRKVNPNSFSSPYISKGDRIVQIEGVNASQITEAEVALLVNRPRRCLELIICKDDKPKQCAVNSFSSQKQPSQNSLEDNSVNSFRRQRNHPRISSTALRKIENEEPSSSASETADGETCEIRKYVWRREDRSSASSEGECDRELAKYSKTPKFSTSVANSHFLEWNSSTVPNNSCEITHRFNNFETTTSSLDNIISQLHSSAYDFAYQPESMSSTPASDISSSSGPRNEFKNDYVSKIYIRPQDLSSEVRESFTIGQQISRNEVDSSTAKRFPTASMNVTMPPNILTAAPGHPAPPPPPPPMLNGNSIPSIRLKSEVSDRSEPPSKLQTAMNKDKKPFTYTPVGIDFSEIKSPRMQRRLIRNVETSGDIVLPSTSSAPQGNLNSLFPSVAETMTPQLAIPVFPQNNVILKTKPSNGSPSPTTPPNFTKSPTLHLTNRKHPSSSPGQGTNEDVNGRTNLASNNSYAVDVRSQVGPFLSRAVTPGKGVQPKTSEVTFPTLREALTPSSLQKPQQQLQKNVAPWVSRNIESIQNIQIDDLPQNIYQRKLRTSPVQASKMVPNVGDSFIKFKGNKQPAKSAQKWTNNKNAAVNNSHFSTPIIRLAHENNHEPSQSRSFKAIQKIIGSDDDTTKFHSNVPSNSEDATLSQLRKLNLNKNDQLVFTNRDLNEKDQVTEVGVTVIHINNNNNNNNSSVGDDKVLHMEKDLCYRGSKIPSKAFQKLQNMTDNEHVIANSNSVTPPNGNNCKHYQISVKKSGQPASLNDAHQIVTENRPLNSSNSENENGSTFYIPPSEREVEQETRKYMGSSIPSRSFKMLQAMTASPDSLGQPGISNF